jgi:hypothetical protein
MMRQLTPGAVPAHGEQEASQGWKNDEEGYREENPGGDTLGSVFWRSVSVRA